MSVNTPLGATSPGSGAFELRVPARARVGFARREPGVYALGGLVVLSLLICVAASSTYALMPASIRAQDIFGLAGLFGDSGLHLPAGVLLPVFALLFGCYVVAVRAADRLSPRMVLGAIAALIVIVLIAPALMSTDVFSYEAYARMIVSYGANPYLHGPSTIQLDFIYPFVGNKWINTPTVYGPVFTLLSALIDKLTFGAHACLVTNARPTGVCYRAVVEMTFTYKAVAAGAAIAIIAMLWQGARLRGLNPVRAVAVFGLNPLVIIYGIGGGHNDLLMLVFSTFAVYALLAKRERGAGSSVAVATAVKLTAGVLLPFMLASGVELGASERRRRILGGLAAGGVVTIAAGVIAFGPSLFNLLPTLQRIQSMGDTSSVPGFLSIALHLHVLGRVLGVILGLIFLTVLAWLVRRVWRGEMDWIDGAGWATLAMLMAASSMLPWYVAWLMPLVALGTSRRLWNASLVFTGVIQLITMLAYIPHWAGA